MNDALRILHVQDHTIPEMSGYAFRSRYLVETERRFGIDAEVVSSARHAAFPAREEVLDGIRFHRTSVPDSAFARLQLRIPFWRERVLTRALTDRIVEVAGRFRPHLLHAHSPMFNGMAALAAARRLRIPVVYQIRAFWEDDAVDKGKFKEGSFVYRQVRRLETGVCRAAAQVVAICEGLRNDIEGRGIDRRKLSLVTNGVDASKFQPIPADRDLARRHGLDGADVIAFIGSFFRYEGLPLLVEAVARLKDRMPRLRLLLVGGGEDEQPTRARAADLGVSDLVVFTGRVPHAEIDAYYSISDLLVYPRISRRITELVTPLKPLEALAMEKAVLGSDVGGIKDLFEDCGVGRLFRAGSVDALSEAILEWFETPKIERDRERQQGRTNVIERRSWERVVQPILPVYERLTRDREGNGPQIDAILPLSKAPDVRGAATM